MSNNNNNYRDNLASGSQSGAQTAATALAVNSARVGFQIQNQGTNPLFIYLGSGASSTVYHFILKASTGAADGTGGSYGMLGGDVYRGLITVGGTSPSYSVFEI